MYCTVQDHNYFVQEIRARSSQYLPCQKQNQEIVYILDPYLKACYLHKSNGINYPLTLVQDVCDILPALNEKIKFIVMNINQASKREYADYCTVLLCYLILKDRYFHQYHKSHVFKGSFD